MVKHTIFSEYNENCSLQEVVVHSAKLLPETGCRSPAARLASLTSSLHLAYPCWSNSPYLTPGQISDIDNDIRIKTKESISCQRLN